MKGCPNPKVATGGKKTGPGTTTGAPTNPPQGAVVTKPGLPSTTAKRALAGAGRQSVSAPSTAAARTAFVTSFFVIFRHLLSHAEHRDRGVVLLGVAAEKKCGSRHRRRAGHERERGLRQLTRRGPAQLPYRLGHQVHALDVAFGEAAARGVGGQPPIGPLEVALRREGTRLAGATEAVGLE